MAASRKDRPVVHLLVTIDFFRLIKLVSCDLEVMAVGIAKVNGARNFVVLEFEIDTALFKLLLRCNKTIAIGTKGEMQHFESAGGPCRF